MKISNIDSPPPKSGGDAAIGCVVVLAGIVLVPTLIGLAAYFLVGFALGPLWFTLWLLS